MLSKKHFFMLVRYVFHNEHWKPPQSSRILDEYILVFTMEYKLDSYWINALEAIGVEIDWKSLQDSLEFERANFQCYPPFGNELKALRCLSPRDVKVVICGQDPYHGPGQADGFAFSVGPGVEWPPSLRNIVREYESDLKQKWSFASHWSDQGALAHWSHEGVLLLNDVLTVRAGEAGSHHSMGWQELTSGVFQVLCAQERPIVFILWGKEAQKKSSFVHRSEHLVLESAHPSPLSAYRGFWGSRPFSRANDWLTQHKCAPVKW